MDRVFRGLAELLWGVPKGKAQGKSEGAALPGRRKTPFIPTLLLGFTFYLKLYILVIFLTYSNIDL